MKHKSFHIFFLYPFHAPPHARTRTRTRVPEAFPATLSPPLGPPAGTPHEYESLPFLDYTHLVPFILWETKRIHTLYFLLRLQINHSNENNVDILEYRVTGFCFRAFRHNEAHKRGFFFTAPAAVIVENCDSWQIIYLNGLN